MTDQSNKETERGTGSAATMRVTVITCGGCGKAVTPAIPWPHREPLIVSACVECLECGEKEEVMEVECPYCDHWQKRAKTAEARLAEARAQKQWEDNAVLQADDAREEALCRAGRVEAQLREYDAENTRLEIANRELEARLAEAEKKLKDEREYSEWLQSECDEAQDDYEKAEARAARLGKIIKPSQDLLDAATIVVLAEMSPIWSEDNPVHVRCARQIAEVVLRCVSVSAQAALREDEQPDDSDAGLVWPKNEVRRTKAKRGEARVRPPFVISDDAERPEESEEKK